MKRWQQINYLILDNERNELKSGYFDNLPVRAGDILSCCGQTKEGLQVKKAGIVEIIMGVMYIIKVIMDMLVV